MDTKDLEVKINNRGGRSISYWKDGVLVGKKCTVCGEDKEISEFNFVNKKKGIYQPVCRECASQYNKKRYENNKGIQKEKNKQWRERNKEHVKEYRKQYYENNKEYCKEKHKHWEENNREYRREYRKQYREANKECYKKYSRRYKEYKKKYGKQYRESNKNNNITNITNMLHQINPILKELNIKAYGSIYKFENVKTGKVYIGQTIIPLKYRYCGGVVKGWIEERKHYRNQKFTEELIEEDFIYTEILDIGCCKYHLDKLEVYYIDKYNSCNDGYNIEHGNHSTDDGLDEFLQILEENELEFVDNKIIKKRLPKQA